MKIIKRVALVLVILTAMGALGIAYVYHRAFDRVEGEYFDSGGVRIHYTDEGAGEPVVLVHGFAFDADLNWRSPGVTQALAENYRVIALDNRGHGLSDKPHEIEAYGDEMPRDIVRLLDHLDIDKAHVIGYSMGGFITLKLIEMHPERLLSAAPCGIGYQELNEENAALIERIATALEKERSFAPLLDHLEMKIDEDSLSAKAGMAFMKARNDLDALAAVMRAFPEFLVSAEAMRNNAVPTLCVVGETDPLTANIDQLHDAMANQRVVVVPNAGHGKVPGTPAFLAAIQAFLAGPSGYVAEVAAAG